MHPALKVGGPVSAAGWAGGLLERLDAAGVPLDFVAAPASGGLPAALRPLPDRNGLPGAAIWCPGPGPGPSPGAAHPGRADDTGRGGDTVSAAACLLRDMRPALGKAGVLSPGPACDYSGGQAVAGKLFHGGPGLLSAGNLRKPRFWALALLARLGPQALPVRIDGDGAWSMVEALAARASDGRITVLAWSCVPDSAGADGDPGLAREVRLHLRLPEDAPYMVRHHRIGAGHSNIVAIWERISTGRDWPDHSQWQLLKQANVLAQLPPTITRKPAGGELAFAFRLPVPAVSCLELIPQAARGSD